MSNLEELEAKIRKLCPELQELSAGCKFLRKTLKNDTDWTILWDHKHWFWWGSDCTLNVFTKEMMALDLTIEILWHPIHIEHILKCLPPQYWIDGVKSFVYLGIDGWNNFYASVSKGCHPLQQYNLSLPLNKQSEETIAFLNSVIK